MFFGLSTNKITLHYSSAFSQLFLQCLSCCRENIIINARIHEGILCVGTEGSFAAFEVTVRSCFCLSALSLAACRRLKHSSGFWDFGPWQSNCSSVCVWTHIPIGGLPQLCVSHLHSAHICSSLTETQRALWAKMSKRDLISYSTLQY